MELTADEVRRVAKLCRIALGDDEVARLQGQLGHILEQFDVLRQLDTEAIPPTAQVIALQNVMRDDRSRPSYPPEEILSNAPRREDDYFRVRAVLE